MGSAAPASGGDRSLLTEAAVVGGLVVVQVINSGFMVFLDPILSLGIKPAFLIVFGSLSAAAFAIPLGAAIERKKWPARLSCTLLAQFVLIALGGVTTFQALLLLGLKNTSPAMASAMPNLAPGFIFFFAACLRYEKVDMRCRYTKMKIAGTLACLSGAVAMSFLQSPTSTSSSPPQDQLDEWVLGCFYLLAAVLVVSFTVVLQAAVMIKFPAPLSLCGVTSLIGAGFTLVLQTAVYGNFDVGSPAIDLRLLTVAIVSGGIVTALCLAFQTWCVQREGPVLVSMFSPIQTVCSAVMSAIFLKKNIQIQSAGGMLLMFAGLYMVLWAKKKEDGGGGSPTAVNDDDVETPLLS